MTCQRTTRSPARRAPHSAPATPRRSRGCSPRIQGWRAAASRAGRRSAVAHAPARLRRLAGPSPECPRRRRRCSRSRAQTSTLAVIGAGARAETALHWAASSDDLALLDALLDAGANIEARGAVIGGGTPIADATAFGQWRAAERLLERGACSNLFESSVMGLKRPRRGRASTRHPHHLSSRSPSALGRLPRRPPGQPHAS